MSINTCPFTGTSGTAVSVSNAGASPALSGISSGTAVVFDNTFAAHGATSAKSTSGSQSGWWLFSGSPTAALVRGYVYIPATFTADTTLGTIYYNATTRAAQLIVGVVSAGHYRARLQTQGSGSITIRATDSADTPIGSWVRWELLATSGTSATTGTARAAIYALDSTTPIWDSGLITGVDTAGTQGSFVGGQGRVTFGPAYNTDDSGMKDGTDAVWGAWVANTPPTQVLTANQNVAAGATVTVTTTPTDDGSIASYAWVYVAASSTGSPALYKTTPGDGITTDQTEKFVAGTAPNLYTLQSTITDDGGLTNVATTEVRVPVAGNVTVTPLPLNGTNAVGTFTIGGGSSTEGAALADSNTATWVESGAVSATAQSKRWRWGPRLPIQTGTIKVKALTDTTGQTGQLVVKLYEGNTVRKTWAAVTVTDTLVEYSFAVDATVTAAIVDPENLWVEAVVTA